MFISGVGFAPWASLTSFIKRLVDVSARTILVVEITLLANTDYGTDTNLAEGVIAMMEPLGIRDVRQTDRPGERAVTARVGVAAHRLPGVEGAAHGARGQDAEITVEAAPFGEVVCDVEGSGRGGRVFVVDKGDGGYGV